jgi:hypothetical protein
MKFRRLVVAVCGVTVPLMGQAASLSDELKRFNQIEIPVDERIIQDFDDGAIAAFSEYKFKCRRQKDFNPKESSNGTAQFKAFLRYASDHPEPTEAEKIERLALLQAAAKAGSWRADYVDLIWDIWTNRNDRNTLQSLSVRLANFAEQGIPIALYGFVHWHEDIPRMERYRILKEAMERGSPQAMDLMGYQLGLHSLALRPLAKEMLTCATSQKNPDAYDGLGQIAWLEGRWVDAYRMWEVGANLGCAQCIGQMEEFVMLNPGFRLSDGFYNSTPRLKALRSFYESQFFYQLTKMTELLKPATADMAFHVSDEQIIALIKRRLQKFGK